MLQTQTPVVDATLHPQKDPSTGQATPLEFYLHSLTEMFSVWQDAGFTERYRAELAYTAKVIQVTETRVREHRFTPYLVLADLNRCELLETMCRQIKAIEDLARDMDFNLPAAITEFRLLTDEAVFAGNAVTPDFSKYV